MRYVRPVPGGTIGRTDQGVDISGPAGTPVLAITREKLVGILQNWYQGQPFYWFQQLNSKGKPTGTYNYVAEQFQSGLQIGQTVNAGQQIGQIAPSGTGLELGFSDARGNTLAHDQGGYTEGVPTQAGMRYRRQVTQTGQAGNSQSNLAQLWIQNGGPANVANLMAAIAMAESHGIVNATNQNSNGTTDRGLWQINSIHSQFNPTRLLNDPNYNAKAAVAVYKSSGLGAWSTYNNGAYRAFLRSAGSATTSGGGYVRPGGEGASSPTSMGPTASDLSTYLSTNDPRTAPPGTARDVSFFGNILSSVDPAIAPLKFALSQEKAGWSQFRSLITGPVSALYNVGEAADDALGESIKIMESLPWYFLRFTEFLVGIIFMGIGGWMLTSRQGSSRSVASDLVAATPIGRARRIRNATRLGRREGQAEHYRLAARREARQTEASKVSRSQAKQLQASGKNAGGSNR